MNQKIQDQNPNTKDFRSRFEERRLRREERRAARGGGVGGAIIVGISLVLFGLVLLLANLGNLPSGNWWALFFLIPATTSFLGAYYAIQQSGGRLNRRARGSLFVGLIFILVTGIFLFQLNWLIWGPALLILVGIGLLVNTLLPE